MVHIIIKDKSTQAKQMIEFLKTQSYVEIIDEKKPNAIMLKSMAEAKAGEVIRGKNIHDLLEKLKK
jgi:hypothetical protein